MYRSFFLLNKINFDKYKISNDDEAFAYIRRVLNDIWNNGSLSRVKCSLVGLDEFVKFFNRTNSKLDGGW